MQTPLVSVLMTAYNREKFIAEAIESVLVSSYTNFELIIVDDCSKDRTVEIAKSYEAKDIRIKVYVNEQNLGDYPNRNKAASYSKGKYLKYLDSDDTMTQDCLQIMVLGMEINLTCGFGISSRSIDYKIVHTTQTSYRVHFFERGILDIGPSGTIIRKDVFLREGGFSGKRCVSDFEFWLKLAKKYDVLEMEKDLVYWRRHENQEFNMGKIDYLEHTISIIEHSFDNSPLHFYEKKNIIDMLRKSTSRYLLKNLLKIGLQKTLYLWRVNNLRIQDII